MALFELSMALLRDLIEKSYDFCASFKVLALSYSLVNARGPLRHYFDRDATIFVQDVDSVYFELIDGFSGNLLQAVDHGIFVPS